jgi:hypothetical protein
MSCIIQFPEINKGGLKAVQYGCQDVVIYDTVVNERQAVWNELDLDDAENFMASVVPYLEAFKTHEVKRTKESRILLDTTWASVPAKYQTVAFKIAFRRYRP